MILVWHLSLYQPLPHLGRPPLAGIGILQAGSFIAILSPLWGIQVLATLKAAAKCPKITQIMTYKYEHTYENHGKSTTKCVKPPSLLSSWMFHSRDVLWSTSKGHSTCSKGQFPAASGCPLVDRPSLLKSMAGSMVIVRIIEGSLNRNFRQYGELKSRWKNKQ